VKNKIMKKSKLNIYIMGAFVLFVTSYFIIWNFVIWNYKINGVIKNISHNEKGYPRVQINGNSYGFSFGKTEILLGDSISKKEKSFWVYQFRKGELVGSYKWD
jgi:hypothetical protein